jgi:putative flippase GtrA
MDDAIDRAAAGSLTLSGPRDDQSPAGAPSVLLDLVLPVYDEQGDLEPSVRTLHEFLSTRFPHPFRITIADNASTDATPGIAARLAAELPHVVSVRLERKGRGRALRAVWAASDAAVLAYCDIDLSTDLAALPPLVAPLVSGHSELAIGTRLAPEAHVMRGPKREIVSRCYNLILRVVLGVRFSDAQCGFKAIRSDAARDLLPLVRDDGWFFDTELLVLAERSGMRIHEVPVDWIEDPCSSVDLVATAIADLLGVLRVGRALATRALPPEPVRRRWRRPERPSAPGMRRRLGGFAAVGLASSALHLLLFLLLRGPCGALAGNASALLFATAANTAANRRWTFGLRGRRGAGRQQLQGFLVLALGLGLTSAALALQRRMLPGAGAEVQVLALVVANAVATVLRFVVFHLWVFRDPAGRPRGPRGGAARERRGVPVCGR